MTSILVPTLGLDTSLLTRLAESIDYPIQQKTIIMNGPPNALDEWSKQHKDWKILFYPKNMGVAGSWNLAPMLMPHEKWWLICNDDAWFQPGYLKRIVDCADANSEKEPIIYLNDSLPFYCFVWTLHGMVEFGWFDENYWCAYYEDCDLRVRHRLAGKTEYVYALQGLEPMHHGKPKCGGTDYNAMLQAMGLFNRNYWRRKWGTDSREQAEFKTPYNKPELTVKDWQFDDIRRARMRPIWDEFMSVPNPSIYT